ncbi:hypothetical protein [Ramlibacter sp.]|uniref:hypothetical protein n=1 Tax=Ramlibacter sp. TaxID=1917967 RepID=UPI003D0FEE18
MTDRIVTFPGAEKPELPENPLRIESSNPKPHGWCEHARITLDPYQRVVICGDCRQVLDPFNFLRDNAKTLQRAWDNHRACTAMVAELNDRIGVLKAEEDRTKARLRRLRDKEQPLDTRGKL